MVFNLFKFLIPSSGGAGYLRSSGSVKPQTVEAIIREWANIEVLIRAGQPSQLRQALISADKSLDNALRDIVSGETMGERLKNAAGLFERDLYNKIWSAHKMRNSLVHESGYEPMHHMITKGINDLKNALNVLKVKV